MFRQAGISLVAAILVSLPSLVLARTWTSRDGRRIEADYVTVDETAVTLKKSDGKEVKVKLELLSVEDQAFLRGILARKAAQGGTTKPKSESDSPFEAAEPAAGDKSPFETVPGTDSRTAKPKKSGDGEKSSDVPGWMNDEDESPSGSSTKKKMKPENRTWEDRQGEKTTGKFVRIVGNEVVILRSGRQIRTDYWQLSSEDQKYVKDLLTANGQERLIPRIDPSTIAGNIRGTGQGAMPAGIPNMPAAGMPPVGIPGGIPGAMPATRPAPYTPATPPPTYQASTIPAMPSTNMPSAMPSSTIPDYPRVTSRNMPSAAYMPPSSTYTPPTMPTYSAPAMPSMPSTPMFVTQKQCMKCGAVLPEHFTAGNSCPKCGVYFARDETNGRTDYTGGFRFGSPRLLVRGIISLGVLAVTGISFCVWLATGRKS